GRTIAANAPLSWRHFGRICGVLKRRQIGRVYVVSRRDPLEEQHRRQRTGPADALTGLSQIASLVARRHSDRVQRPFATRAVCNLRYLVARRSTATTLA